MTCTTLKGLGLVRLGLCNSPHEIKNLTGATNQHIERFLKDFVTLNPDVMMLKIKQITFLN